jgi:hypothetical protein
MDNAIINANSSNPVTKPADILYITTEGFQFYDTGSRAIITRIKFMNYFRPSDWVISTLTHADNFKPQGEWIGKECNLLPLPLLPLLSTFIHSRHCCFKGHQFR